MIKLRYSMFPSWRFTLLHGQTVLLSMEMFGTPFNKNTSLWHLKASLLTNPSYKEQIKHELLSFFKSNDVEDIDKFVLWNTHKAVMRGILIKFSALRKGGGTKTSGIY